eukprot:m.228822 g.228822  ORF g.228822 m.228822 type:complete len:371 (+) comp17607_c0_seq1:46-1158(+)
MSRLPRFPLIPGPVMVSEEVRKAYAEPYGSADLEEEFFTDYKECARGLAEIANTKNDVAILSGEGMIALWGALKSVLRRGDHVLSICNGIYGEGIADMAVQLGASVSRIEGNHHHHVDRETALAAIERSKPRLVTVVHCDTPTGLINDLTGIGAAVHAHGGLLYVDMVSSFAAMPVDVDENGIDLALIGSQKALSCNPDVSAVAVSARAWHVIEDVGYVGYDALLPFRHVLASPTLPLFPYTHNWAALAGLKVSLGLLLTEGMPAVYQRHRECAALTRTRLTAAGLTIFTEEHSTSPSCTAVVLPNAITWPALDKALRARGVVVGGSYGAYSGKLFRVGHMGTQAQIATLTLALEEIVAAIEEIRKAPHH